MKYNTKYDREVYCVFLDANKAFDKVLHNGLLKTRLDAGKCLWFVCVSLTRYWCHYGTTWTISV